MLLRRCCWCSLVLFSYPTGSLIVQSQYSSNWSMLGVILTCQWTLNICSSVWLCVHIQLVSLITKVWPQLHWILWLALWHKKSWLLVDQSLIGQLIGSLGAKEFNIKNELLKLNWMKLYYVDLLLIFFIVLSLSFVIVAIVVVYIFSRIYLFQGAQNKTCYHIQYTYIYIIGLHWLSLLLWHMYSEHVWCLVSVNWAIQ